MRRTQRRAVQGSGRGSSGTQGRRQSRRQRARRIEGSRGSIDSSRSEAWLDVGTVLGVGGQCGEQSRWHWAPNHEDSTTYASPPRAFWKASETQPTRCATAQRRRSRPAHACVLVACHSLRCVVRAPMRTHNGQRAGRGEPASWPVAAETTPATGSASGPRLHTQRVHRGIWPSTRCAGGAALLHAGCQQRLRLHLAHAPLFCHPSGILPVHPSVEALCILECKGRAQLRHHLSAQIAWLLAVRGGACRSACGHSS
jgi:hypothetical protein